MLFLHGLPSFLRENKKQSEWKAVEGHRQS